MKSIADYFRKTGRYALLLVCLAGCFAGIACSGNRNADLGNGLFARIRTNRGSIVVKLEFERAPITVCNFTALAEGKMDVAGGKPYFDGLIFHRVISRRNGDNQDFIIQSGDPLGNGTGGPGYSFPDEIDPALTHETGTLSMANSGPNTNGSQFFITLTSTPHLDGQHSVFGYVVEGQKVVSRVKYRDKIKKVEIIRNGPAANAFKTDQAAFDTLIRNYHEAEAAKARARRDADLVIINTRYGNAPRTASGIWYVIERPGTGDKPAPGMTVKTNYRGSLLSGRIFDSTDFTGRPADFQAGAGNVVPGWDEMILDMRVGEKRTIVIPPEQGYGDTVVGNGAIPANSYLVFEIELLEAR